MKVKHLRKLSQPIIRKRDGAELTHVVHLAVTDDEAMAISEMFERSRHNNQSAPSMSLIRVALLYLAERNESEELIIERMAKTRTREELAAKLSRSECDKAILLLDASKTVAKSPPVKKPERRVWVNPDANKRR